MPQKEVGSVSPCFCVGKGVWKLLPWQSAASRGDTGGAVPSWCKLGNYFLAAHGTGPAFGSLAGCSAPLPRYSQQAAGLSRRERMGTGEFGAIRAKHDEEQSSAF